MSEAVTRSTTLPGPYSPASLSRFGEPGAPNTEAARKKAQDGLVQDALGGGQRPPALTGGSPLLRGLEPGSELGGVSMRGASRGPQSFDKDRDTTAIMRGIDQRGAGDRSKIDNAGLRALDGLANADRDNLRLNRGEGGILSIDRQHIDDRGQSTWRQVWEGKAPEASSKDPAAAWSVLTQDAGDRLARDYRENPYNNRAPLNGDAFPDAARGAVEPVQPTREHPGRVRKPTDWGLPVGHARG